MKFIKFSLGDFETCSRCGRMYDGSYCVCMENDE